MNKCILFSRVSTISQTLESQTNELRAEAERLGYSVQQQIPIEYKESAISLSLDERKGIQELQDRISDDPSIDCVIVFEISRLSRQAAALFKLRDWLIERQIQLVCLKPYMRLLEDGKMSQTASILFSLFSSISESEMILKKERMLRGRHFKRENLGYIGGRILLGYRVGADDRIEIDFDEAETVRKIFKWYSEGKSMIWIARELQERGVCAKRWHGLNSYICNIRELLRREEYTGKKCHTYHYPRIISDELFAQVAKLVTRNKAKYITRKRYLGQGLIREKSSGLLMSANESTYQIYRIGKKRDIILNTPAIEKWLWEISEKRAKTIGVDKANEAYIHDQRVLNHKLRTIAEETEQLHMKIDKTNERIINGKMNEAKGDEMIREFENEIKRLEEQHDKLTEKLLSLKPNEIDMSDRKAVVNNEIAEIIASRGEDEPKARVRILEVHFKDGTTEIWHYKSWSKRCWIEKMF